MPITRVLRPQIYRPSNGLSDYAGVILSIIKCYFWSIRHNAGIIQIFLEHNAVVSEKGVFKFCQQLAQEYIELMKAGSFEELDTLDSYPGHFGIIEGVVTSLCHDSKLVYGAWICIMGELHNSGSAAGDQPGIAATSLANQSNEQVKKLMSTVVEKGRCRGLLL